MVKIDYLKLNFFKGETFSIQSFCINSCKSIMCVLKKHSQYFRIEVWNLTFLPFIEKEIYENDFDLSLIESINFGLNDRLFACSLKGTFYEIDINHSRLIELVKLTNGPAWCLVFNYDKSLAAIGADNGISFISIVPNLIKLSEKSIKNDRTLSLSFFGEKENLIAAGSTGSIKIFNHLTLDCIAVLKLQKDAIVWSLIVLKQWIIVSGDSKGALNFFDGRNFVLINRIASHEADILCLCKDSSDSNKIYASGVDPVISAFKLDKNDQGVATYKFQLQNHDVHSLISDRGWLISGGVDSHIYYYNRNERVALSPEFSNQVQFFDNLVLFQYLKHLEIWKIPSAQSSSSIPLKYIEIKSKHVVIKSGFIENWIAYSNYDKLKVLRINEQNIVKVPLILEPFEGIITDIKFVNNHYLTISFPTSIYILHLNENGVLIENKFKYKKPLHLIQICSKYLVACFKDFSLIFFSTSDWSMINEIKLDTLPIFLRFDPKKHLFMGTSRRSLIRYNIELNKMNYFECNQFDLHLPFKDICFFANNWIVYDESKLYYFAQEKFLKSIDIFEKIVKLDYLSNLNKLIVIELTYEMMIRNLPSALIKKRFGI